MINRILLLALSATLLTGCGYEGQYRYECQDPANWEKAECKAPICTASGTCAVDLVPSLKEGTPNE